jgi:GTP cyclohydrolase I
MLMKSQSTMKPSDADEGIPVSVKIRERLLAARKRFHANDNIADFIEPGEIDQLLDEDERRLEQPGD